jgi:hypothetical protein
MNPSPFTVLCPLCGRGVRITLECVLDGPVIDGEVTVKIVPNWVHQCPSPADVPFSDTIAA